MNYRPPRPATLDHVSSVWNARLDTIHVRQHVVHLEHVCSKFGARVLQWTTRGLIGAHVLQTDNTCSIWTTCAPNLEYVCSRFRARVLQLDNTLSNWSTRCPTGAHVLQLDHVLSNWGTCAPNGQHVLQLDNVKCKRELCPAGRSIQKCGVERRQNSRRVYINPTANLWHRNS